MSQRNKITLILFLILFIGAGFIIYYGRPVMKIKQTNSNQVVSDNNDISVTPTFTEDSINNMMNPSYTLTEIMAHNNADNCWSAINGDVYDLSTWVSRHPGGSQKIINMCGEDASSGFNGMHGSSTSAKAALVLLKIGSLK
ncbi:cytochrome b5 domain-containing protein [Candidatus Falkowbacteria bacterium]|nr:cytochrome b5 domain-containing protein [Candidatus Falkowbacteria bacterium]NCQ12786.1 cytochrome b5 domain-containing protein [Candidatus Falkowbacteria bacterium]